MKCEVTSDTTHDVLISEEIGYKSYREICSQEPKKVNLGFNNDPNFMIVKNNTLIEGTPPRTIGNLKIELSKKSQDWEVLLLFFSIHNIEPNWLNCHFSWGWYSPELGGWTGCMGKV